jgi:antitoxin component of MazEF toxin-antitoxin module
MKARIARWGSNLGVRIPSEIAVRVGLAEGASVEIEIKNDRIVLTPRRRATGSKSCLSE